MTSVRQAKNARMKIVLKANLFDVRCTTTPGGLIGPARLP